LLVSPAVFSKDGPQETKQELGIDEHLGGSVPLDAVFFDEYGKPVTLGSLITRPTILMLVYYRCPGICSPIMNSVASDVDKLDMEPGKDYNLITISFDPREEYTTASAKKENYLDMMKKKIPADSWRFLTGDSLNIAKITDAVGFRYKKQDNDFMHSAVITVLSPNGKIARYLYGTDFLPLEIKLALTEAAEGKTGPTINKLLKFCFSYDPAGRKYVLNFTRIAGGIMLLLVAGFVFILTYKKKKNIHPINGHSGELGKRNI
jgi:protein SCO1/2